MKRFKIAAAIIIAIFYYSTSYAQTDSTSVAQDDSLLIDKNLLLGEIKVTAQKPLVKMEADKLSYDVQGDADAKTNTVLDMLRKVPLVTVDGEDKINVNGNTAFKVYVDGKPNAMMSANPSQIFKAMPATAIKSIEVITNPGAKYDAEGGGAVLNLVTNKNKGLSSKNDGFIGTFRLMGGNQSQNLTTFVSGQKGRLSYSANAFFDHNDIGIIKVDAFREQQSNDATSTVHTTLDVPQKVNTGVGSLQLGYEIDSLSSLNGTVSLSAFRIKSDQKGLNDLQGAPYGDGINYEQQLRSRQNNKSFTASLDYLRFLNAARSSSITIIYQFSHNPTKKEENSQFSPISSGIIDLSDRFSSTRESTNEHILQTDYTTPLTKNQALNAGAKLTARRASSDADYYIKEVYDDATSLDFLFTTTIAAAYAEYAWQGQALSAKGGLRYEQTWQKAHFRSGAGSDFSKQYGSLVPSVSLSWRLAPATNLGLNYTLKISRPGISYLNPYVNRTTPTVLTYGNSQLEAEDIHNFELSLSHFTNKFMLRASLDHNFCDNAIEQYSSYENDILNTTYGNIVKRHRTGANLFLSWLPIKETRLLFNGGISYIDLRSDLLQLSNHGWQPTTMLGLQQTLPKKYQLSFYWVYAGKKYTQQGWTTGYNLGVANLSKSFLNDRLSVGIQALTSFEKGGKMHMKTYTRDTNFYNMMRMDIPLTRFSISVSYTIGSQNFQKKTHETKVESDFIEKKATQSFGQDALDIK